MRFIRKNIMLIIFFLMIVFLLIFFFLKRDLIMGQYVDDSVVEISNKEDSLEDEVVVENVYVDIKGAVVQPGVYEIENNKKVIDVINLAGGFTDVADTSMINLAKKVYNEMVVIIYTKDEVKKWTEPNQIIKYVDKQCICPNIKNDGCLKGESNNNDSSDDRDASEGNKDVSSKVNINTATLEELQTISGIGESKARAIIDYRNDKGLFKSIEEIKEVSGIGDSLYEKIKDSITV